MPDVPTLANLMGAYFHQDWDIHGDEWDVVDVYIRDNPRSASTLVADIEATLTAYPDEAGLRSFILDDLGACYLADLDGGTYHEWLTQIADRVRAATDAS